MKSEETTSDIKHSSEKHQFAHPTAAHLFWYHKRPVPLLGILSERQPVQLTVGVLGNLPWKSSLAIKVSVNQTTCNGVGVQCQGSSQKGAASCIGLFKCLNGVENLDLSTCFDLRQS